MKNKATTQQQDMSSWCFQGKQVATRGILKNFPIFTEKNLCWNQLY